jgi:cell division protein FtsW (lipid II flippase)
MDTMRKARTPFALLAFGLTASIGLQAFLNMAVVTVMTPTTGISLPLISAGGSGLVATCLALGLLCAIGRDHDVPVRGAADPEWCDDVLPAKFVLMGDSPR